MKQLKLIKVVIIFAMDWDDSLEIAGKTAPVKIEFLAVQHWSARSNSDRNETLDQPISDLKIALDEAGIERERFLIPLLGESFRNF